MRKITKDDLKKGLEVTVKFRGKVNAVKTDRHGIRVCVDFGDEKHWTPFDKVFIWDPPINPARDPKYRPLTWKDNPPPTGEKVKKMKMVHIDGPITARSRCPNCLMYILIDLNHNPNVCEHCDKWYSIWIDLNNKKSVLALYPHKMSDSKVEARQSPGMVDKREKP